MSFKCFLVSLVCAVITIQREPVSAVSSDINFPMKGRRGMKDWARTAEDKLYIPKEVFTIQTEGRRPKTDTAHCPLPRVCHNFGLFGTTQSVGRSSHALKIKRKTKQDPCFKGFSGYNNDSWKNQHTKNVLTLITNMRLIIFRTKQQFQNSLLGQVWGLSWIWICFSCYPHSRSWILETQGPDLTPLNPLFQPRSDQKVIPVWIHKFRDVSCGSR